MKVIPMTVYWTPISEKKPPYEKDVLLFLKSGEQMVGHRVNVWEADMYTDGRMGSGYVWPTHWMELPGKP